MNIILPGKLPDLAWNNMVKTMVFHSCEAVRTVLMLHAPVSAHPWFTWPTGGNTLLLADNVSPSLLMAFHINKGSSTSSVLYDSLNRNGVYYAINNTKFATFAKFSNNW